MNERAVEVAFVWDMIKDVNRNRILEVGNVLKHYFNSNHDVVDKYEVAPGVLNVDVVSFETSKKYDAIVSISTLEHVGYDEDVKDDAKILEAIAKLRSKLSAGGKMIITLPIGYNPNIDRLISERKIPFSQFFCLKRISRDNQWKQVVWAEIEESKYARGSPSANALILGIIES